MGATGSEEGLKSTEANPKRANTSILLIEDDEVLRGVLVLHLESCGYEVVAKADAEAAWEHLERAEGPWIIITDNQMPGLLGMELLERLCARNALSGGCLLIGAVLMSGNIQPEQIGTVAAQLLALGVGFEFIGKPFGEDILALCVERFIREGTARGLFSHGKDVAGGA